MKRKKRFFVCVATCMAFLAACASFPLRAGANTPDRAGDYAYWYNEQYQGYEITKFRGTALSIKIPQSIGGIPVTSVGKEAFAGTSIVEAVLPDSVIAVGDSAFEECARLRNVTLSRNLKTLGKRAFQSCKRLNGVNLPESLAELPSLAFAACRRLEEIEIPKNIERIGSSAFSGSGLKRVSFSKDSKLSEIKRCAFLGCFLEEICFPDSLEKIGDGAFSGCARLKKVVFGKNPPPKGLNEICDSARKDAVIKTPAKYRARYKRLLKKCRDYRKTMRIK